MSKIYTIAQAVEKLKIAKKYERIPIKMRGMYAIEDDFEKLGYTHDPGDGDNTNGWEVDFWYQFTHPTEPTITVSGGIWQHGDTYHISKKED